jgi:serine/threonine protein kinase
LGDRFVVEQILGAGSSGAVYGVRDELMGRGAALKVLWEEADEGDPAFERLRREILAAQSIQDPRVVAIYELLILEGRPALVMERVEGSTLRQRIQREGPMPPEEAARVLRDILGALVLLHAAGIVHRDVKSGNILLAPDGAVKLGDFGLVKGDDLGGVTLTATGTTLGTPGYMAPEVIRGETATPRSDLYGAGVILFELLTGRLPFEGNSAVEVAGKHLTQQPPMGLLQEKRTPRWLAQIAARLLEKDPADRFASPKEALAALDRRRRSLRLNRRARLSALAAALLLGMASFAVWFVLRPGSLTATFHDTVLEARDASSHVLWSQTLPNTIQSAVAGRFGPKGSWAVACSTQWNAAHSDLRGVEPSEWNAPSLWVYDRRGKLLLRLVSPLAFKGFSPRFTLHLSSHRFAPGESERLVIYAHHMTWHPSGLLVYSFQGRQPWETGVHSPDLIVRNSGGISGWVYKDLLRGGQHAPVLV